MSSFLGRLGLSLAKLAKFQLGVARVAADSPVEDVLLEVPASLTLFTPPGASTFIVPYAAFTFTS